MVAGSSRAISVVLAILTAANISVSVYLWSHRSAEKSYTYTLDDYPEHWPLPFTPPVALAIEDSAHYGIDQPDAREEWATTTAMGFGYVRLGPERRAFALSMFHQLHCLRLMRKGLAGDYQLQTKGHFRHCLNYLRQLILCHPDLTLEPADVLDSDRRTRQPSSVHVCADWRRVYNATEDNYAAWVRERAHFVNHPDDSDIIL